MRSGLLIRICTTAFLAALTPLTPLSAKTVDLDTPLLPGPGEAAPAGPLLPDASPALAETDKKTFADALKAFVVGNFTSAEALSRGLTRTSPEAPETWYLLGLSLANLDRREEAVEAMTRAASLYRVNAEPLVVKGDLLLSLGRLDEAGEAWSAAIALDPGNWRALDRMAALTEKRGDPAAAAALYERSVASSEAGRIYPRLQAARLYLVLGEPARTEALLEPLAAPEDAPSLALDYLARAKVGLDKMDEGEALFDRLIARGQSPRPFVARARLAVADGDLAAAAAVLADAVARFPAEPGLLAEQSRILGAQGRYDLALSAAEAGLAVAPQDAPLLRAASLSASRLGRDDAATGYARTLAALPTATADDRLRLAALLERGGAVDEAVTLYRAVIRDEPENWVALNNLASLLSETAPREAVVLAGRAAALAPGVPTVQDTLGWAQLKAGDLDDAARTYQALQGQTPSSALIAYRLGLVRLQQGRAGEGQDLLRQALTLDPAFAYAEDARQKLQ